MRYCLTTLLVLLFIIAPAQAKPIIYDTDMAIDDWFALLYLNLHPDAELLGVTISTSGESHCQPGLDNVRNLLSLTGTNGIPVACGDAYPQDGYFIFPPEWQKDADTLSGIDLSQWLEKPVTQSTSDGHAAELLHKLVIGSQEAVTIVAVGPMTNIAQWLEKYPEDKSKLAELVMMGGSYKAKGNIIVPNFTDNNPNKVSEWNFFIDPVATRTTLNADISKTMVGLDVTNTVRVTHPFADDFKSHVSSDASKFADQVFDKNRWFIDSGEYYLWDVMAAIVAMNPELCSGDMLSVTGLAEVAGPQPYTGSSDLSMPALSDFERPRSHLLTATAGQVIEQQGLPLTKVCLSTKADTVFKEFIEVLTR